MTRPVIATFAAVSLDGYLATTDDQIDWLEAAGDPTEDYGFDDLVESVDAVAMGRRTWDHIAGITDLPYRDRPIFVFTHRPPTEPRPGVTFWERTPSEAVEAWASLGYRRVYVDGGDVVSGFLAADLVDELTVTFVPILLGDGRPLFHRADRQQTLELVGATPFASGLVTLRYRRIR